MQHVVNLIKKSKKCMAFTDTFDAMVTHKRYEK